MRFAIYLTLLASLAHGTRAAAQSVYGTPGQNKRPSEIRLLCVADDAPLRRVVDSRGVETPLFAGFDEEPPAIVHIRRAGTLTPSPMPRNAVSKAHSDGATKTGKIDGYFIPVFQAESGASAWAKANAAEKSATVAKPETPQWAKLSGPAPDDGKDYLLCFFQPSTKSKWFPPKVMHVDISPRAIPAGTLIVINLSDRPAMLRIGTGKPTVIAPETTHAEPVPTPDAPFPIAVAAKSRSGQNLQMMSVRTRTVAKGHVGVLCLYSLYEKTSDKPVGVRFSTYEANPETGKGK